MDKAFIERIKHLLEENLDNEQFGVSELASRAGISRSSLLRRIQKATGLSASRFIRQYRLERAMEMLRQEEGNVSEITFRVGFNSTSYFIKCFREHYGYPLGEVASHPEPETETPPDPDKVHPGEPTSSSAPKRMPDRGRLILYSGIILLLAIALIWAFSNPGSANEEPERSIAVLPFTNDSDDSTNLYLVNGLMESLLYDLQLIRDVRVISRTSVEKYRDQKKTMPQIARELDVTYIVEGSGQKVGNQIMLNIQLIEGRRDKHLWARQYRREVEDIFLLQQEISGAITGEIRAIITPEERNRLQKIPTENVLAYEYFLKGLDQFYSATMEGMDSAIVLYKRAVELDPGFARAYAGIAITYASMDMVRNDQKHTALINEYADKALLLDDQLAQGLIAKALYSITLRDYGNAEAYLLKALRYHPHSPLVINTLADFYTNYIPNTGKYLTYALKGARLDIASHDSTEISYIYLHIANAFIQNGFVEEAEAYLNKSLSLDNQNLYARQVLAYILYARDKQLEQTLDIMLELRERDSTRLDIVQEVAKLYYFLGDYERSHAYYAPFLQVKEQYNLSIYPSEDAKIALVMEQMGRKEVSDSLFLAFRKYAESNQSLYRDLNLALYYANHGDTGLALDHLREFARHDEFHYWILLFLNVDPLSEPLRELQEYNLIFSEIKARFWSHHNEIRKSLRKEGLLRNPG
jgi:TolB-like protein/AraC-like DNA-binding protein